MKKKIYLFQSNRLGFRKWKPSDLEDFVKLNADPEVMEHFPKTLTKIESELLMEKINAHWVEYGFTYYAVEILASGEWIGMLGLAYQKYSTDYTPAIDIGWRLKKSAWGKGYATEGAKNCLTHAFDDLGIHQLISVCPTTNLRSERVMQKIGMIKMGEFNHPKLGHHPRLEKHYCYRLTNG